MDNANIDKLDDILPHNTRVGNYIIQEIIGSGGMSTVYRAYDERLKRIVALKIINKTQDSLKKLADEAQTMALLDHPNIVRIYDVGTVPCLYFAMEFVKGITLRQWLHRNNNYSIKHLAPILLQLATAIETIHSKNIIHQDIKPSNVLISQNNTVKLMDFGISRVAPRMSRDQEKEHPTAGTPKYMAPEQISGKPSYKSDIYSFGATLYEIICGKPPFQGKSYNVMVDILTNEPIVPSILNSQIAPEIEAICLKCLQKKQQNRYVSAKQLIRDIKNAQNHKKIMAKKYTTFQAAKRFTKRNLLVVMIASSLVIILIGICFYSAQQEQKAKLHAKNASERKIEAEQISKATLEILQQLFSKNDYLRKDPSILKPLRDAFDKIPSAKDKYPILYAISSGLSPQGLKKSLESLNQKIKNDPNNTELYLVRGNIHLEHNMLPEAENDFRCIIKLNPLSIPAYINQANLMQKQKKYRKAMLLYNKANSIKPNFNTYYNRGKLFFAMGELPKAINDYKQAILMNPRSSKAYNNLGLCHFHLQQLDKAVTNYTKAISFDKKNIKFLYNRGRAYSKKKEYYKAIEDYEKFLELNLKPERVGIIELHIAQACFQSQQYDKAIVSYTKAIQLNDNQWNLFHGRAIAYMNKKRYKKAILDLEKTLELNRMPKEQATVYSVIANAYFSLEQYDKAIHSYTMAISLNDRNWKLLYHRSTAYIKQKKYNKAKLDLEKIFKFSLTPKEQATVYSAIAKTNLGLEQYDKAVNNYTIAISLDDKTWSYLYHRAKIYFAQKKYTDAITDLEKVKKSNPNLKLENTIKVNFLFGDCYYREGLYYTGLKQYDKAIDNYTKAISFEKRRWSFFYNRGLIYVKKKSYEKAIIDLEKANKLSPNETLVNFYLGRIYYMQKHMSKAKKHLQISLKKNDLPKKYVLFAEATLKKIGDKK